MSGFNPFAGRRLIDITVALDSDITLPGDRPVTLNRMRRMSDGAHNNLTEIVSCVHNATHADAPLHFIADGTDISCCPPEFFVGECFVKAFSGRITAEHIASLPDGFCRLLVKGDAFLSEEAAHAVVSKGIILFGTERASADIPDTGYPIHKIILGAGVHILERLDLSEAPEGPAFLMAQPLRIRNCEGAPCRALLYVEEQLNQ